MSRTTDEKAYRRRRFIAGALGLGALGGFSALRYGDGVVSAKQPDPAPVKVASAPTVSEETGERLTSKYAATHYNNAYEFGWDKNDPVEKSGLFQLRPWQVTFDGLCAKPGTFDIDDLMGMPFSHLEERIYDFRCVEAWSMVIPYNGRPLKDILRVVEPLGSAKYVAFTSVLRPEQMPGQSSAFSTLDWPYVEALTIEEAMNPLTFATFGVYGDQELPQNGMPFRITVPWKYGFKSPKFVVRITLTEERPEATWHKENSREYGWYSNVYPDISHPRWSQATERRIWSETDVERIPSRVYNGYADEVAHLYPGDRQQYR